MQERVAHQVGHVGQRVDPDERLQVAGERGRARVGNAREGAARRTSRRAGHRVKRSYPLLFGTAATLVVLDQWTKHLATLHLAARDRELPSASRMPRSRVPCATRYAITL